MFYLLTILVAASRFLPHPPNVACLGALGLFAGCYLTGRKAYLVPLVALAISDLVGQALGIAGMGFYQPVTMLMVYAGALLAVPVGRWMRKRRGLWKIPAGSVAASTLFFLLSNFGVWLAGWYPMTGAGLLSCYAYAIPFFGYTVAGDLLFTVLLFGSYQWSRRPLFVTGKPALATVRG